MCGRYTLHCTPDAISAAFGVPEFSQTRLRFNIAPSQLVAAVRQKPGMHTRELVMLKWGLVPVWAKDTSIGNRLANARAETVAEKPSFRHAFKSHRCLLIADGFYEWQVIGRSRQPWRFTRSGGEVFLMAGLWESWLAPGQATPLETFTVITTAPNAVVAPIHDRMPACLDPESAALWLDPRTPADSLPSLLRPGPDAEWTRHRVDPIVGQARIDDPRCIEVLPEQPSLF
ncbi:MAG: SOS response-associated peptidase [Verrucomicrobiota bacterium]